MQIVTSVEDFLSCSICFDFMKNPITYAPEYKDMTFTHQLKNGVDSGAGTHSVRRASTANPKLRRLEVAHWQAKMTLSKHSSTIDAQPVVHVPAAVDDPPRYMVFVTF